MNEERLLSDQNKNPSVFSKPNDPNLTADGGHDHRANDQYGGNGYGQTGSQYCRYGYEHLADYQYRRNERNHKTNDQYGECGSDQADNEGYRVNRRIGSNQRHHFYGNGSYIYSKYFWGNYQNNTETQQPKQNQFI